MNVLDLFSGIGGFSLGLERAGFKTVAFCEIDPFCRKVLKKHWPDVPIYEDIRELNNETLEGSEIATLSDSESCDGERVPGEMGEEQKGEKELWPKSANICEDDRGRGRPNPIHADVITGGYPCQPFSVAGKQLGEKDERHLWPEMLRVIQTVKPRWVIAENVYGHIKLGYDKVATQLEDNNYTVWTFIIPACAVDAPHRRDRVWIVGYSEHNGFSTAKKHRSTTQTSNNYQKGQDKTSKPERASRSRSCEDVANADTQGLQESTCSRIRELPRQAGTFQRRGFSRRITEAWGGWSIEPSVCGVADGLPNGLYQGRVATGVKDRVNRLKSLGNSVVPQIPEIIGRAIMEYEQTRECKND